MADFQINFTGIGAGKAALAGTESSLKTISGKIANVQRGLAVESAAKNQVIRALNKIETNVLRHAAGMNTLSQALQYISERYTLTERMITGNASLFEKLMNSLDTSVYNISKTLGLESLYNTLLYPYASFDEARTQERLMDEYLQYKCFELMERPEYSEETWANATPKEREGIIRNFIKDVNKVLCTETEINVLFDDGKGNTENNGYFSYQGNGKADIYINPDRLRTGDRGVFNTAIHESRHCYQHQAVDYPGDYVVSEETIKQWDNNFKHYISKGNAYYEQPVEWDTFHFAHQEYRTEGRAPQYAGSWGTQ